MIYAEIVRARTNAEWFSHASCHVVALLIYVLAAQVWPGGRLPSRTLARACGPGTSSGSRPALRCRGPARLYVLCLQGTDDLRLPSGTLGEFLPQSL